MALVVAEGGGAAVGIALAGFAAIGIPALGQGGGDAVGAVAIDQLLLADAAQGVTAVISLADEPGTAILLFVAGKAASLVIAVGDAAAQARLPGLRAGAGEQSQQAIAVVGVAADISCRVGFLDQKARGIVCIGGFATFRAHFLGQAAQPVVLPGMHVAVGIGDAGDLMQQVVGHLGGLAVRVDGLSDAAQCVVLIDGCLAARAGDGGCLSCTVKAVVQSQAFAVACLADDGGATPPLVILAQLGKAAWVVDGLQQVGLRSAQCAVFVLGAVACRVLVAGDAAQAVIVQFVTITGRRVLRNDVAIGVVFIAVGVAQGVGGGDQAALAVIGSDGGMALAIHALGFVA